MGITTMRRQRRKFGTRDGPGVRRAARHGAWCRDLAATAAIGLAPLLAGCAAEEPWSFVVTTTMYESADLDSGPADCDPGTACVYVILLAAPLALDLLVLPITLPRDLVERGSPW